MRSSTNFVNENDDLVSGFDAFTCAGENVYDIFVNEGRIITDNSIVCLNTNKKIGNRGSLKFFTITFQIFQIISNIFGIIKIRKIKSCLKNV